MCCCYLWVSRALIGNLCKAHNQLQSWQTVLVKQLKSWAGPSVAHKKLLDFTTWVCQKLSFKELLLYVMWAFYCFRLTFCFKFTRLFVFAQWNCIIQHNVSIIAIRNTSARKILSHHWCHNIIFEYMLTCLYSWLIKDEEECVTNLQIAQYKLLR